MKCWIGAVLAVMVALPLSSCKKNESPEQYDPKTDAPASIIRVEPDNSFGADQIAIAKDVEKSRPIAAPSSAPTASPSAPTTSPSATPATPAPATPPSSASPAKPAPATPPTTSAPTSKVAASGAAPAQTPAKPGLKDTIKKMTDPSKRDGAQ